MTSLDGAGAAMAEYNDPSEQQAGAQVDDVGGRDGGGGEPESDATPASFFWWLQSMHSDMLSGNAKRWPEMLEALSQKHAAALLTSDQALLRGALALHALMPSWHDQASAPPLSDASALADVLAIHKAHMKDSASSALDARVYSAFVSLVVQLHYTYLGITPPTLEDLPVGLGDTNAEQQIDLVKAWTGVEGAPTFNADGTYASVGLVHAPTREQAIAVGHEAQWDAMLSVASVREALRDANSRVAGDAMQSQRVWSLYYQFEISQMPAKPTPPQIEHVKTLFLSRLLTPHVQIDATAQAFSTFVTKTLPSDEYEATMASAYKLVGQAKAALAVCEPYENAVQSTLRVGPSSTATRWAVWKPYVTWSASNAVGAPGQRRQATTTLDVDTVCAHFERALLDCGLPPSCSEESLSQGRPPLTKEELASLRGKESRDQRRSRLEQEAAAIKADREASADLWTAYLHFLGTIKASSLIVLDVSARASQAVSSNGSVLATILRTYGRLRRTDQQIDEFFSTALRNPGIQADGTAMTDLFLARVDVERDQTAHRLVLQGQFDTMQQALSSLAKQPDTFMNIFGIMSFGLDTLAGAGLQDESLRLQRVLADWCLQGGSETTPLAEDYWQAAMKAQPHNGDAWLRASQFAMARSAFDQAKHLLKQGLSRRDVESSKKMLLAEELLHLARVAGTIQDVDWALSRIATERERSWSEYYASYEAQTLAPIQMSSADVDMADDSGALESGGKRKATEANGVASSSQHAGPGSPQQLKKGKPGDARPHRDRENSSVMVDRLPPDAREEDLLHLFKDCGDILGITGPRSGLGADAGQAEYSSAMVEFTSRDSIPAARSRHLKPVRSYQVQVQLGHECTLYVTNFPTTFDNDVAIRGVFGKHGRIFDVRWPSKKFASLRRFCYVVFCSAAEAQAAQQQLHNALLDSDEPNSRMQVFLSDPKRKKVRSDAFNDERELFVTGLVRGVTEEDLRAAFGAEVQDVRIPLHPDGRNKGIAYVDMRTGLDAQRVMGKASEIDGGGYRVKGKLLKVSMVQHTKKPGQSGSGGAASNGSLDGRLDIHRRNCCLRVHGLPADAQEAVIQQLIEQGCGRGSVKRIEWTPGEAGGAGQATVEFVDAATAGRAALEATTTKLSYDEQHPLQLLPLESRGAAARTRSAVSPPTNDARDTISGVSTADGLVPRQAGLARRGGRGRGGLGYVARRAPAVQVAMDVDEDAGSSLGDKPKSQDAFRRMLQSGKSSK